MQFRENPAFGMAALSSFSRHCFSASQQTPTPTLPLAGGERSYRREQCFFVETGCCSLISKQAGISYLPLERGRSEVGVAGRSRRAGVQAGGGPSQPLHSQ